MIDRTGVESRVHLHDADAGLGVAGLFLSGGRSPEYIRYDKNLMRITKHFVKEKKPIAVVCHGIEIVTAAAGAALWLATRADHDGVPPAAGACLAALFLLRREHR